MHGCSVLTTSFRGHLFWTSLPCIIDPDSRDATVLALCLLTGPSEFEVDFVQSLTQVGKYGKRKLKFMAHFLMSACSAHAARHMNDGIRPCQKVYATRYLRQPVFVVLDDLFFPRFERCCLLASRTLLSLVSFSTQVMANTFSFLQLSTLMRRSNSFTLGDKTSIF